MRIQVPTTIFFIVFAISFTSGNVIAGRKHVDETESNDTPDVGSEAIPGTELETRTYYQLGLKRFPGGTLTWTQDGTLNWNYVQIDNDLTHKLNYLPGKQWYKDSLWQFIPVDKCGVSTGWYALRNAGKHGAFLTWFGEYQVSKSYMVVDKRYQDRTEDILLKPVKVRVGKEVYYQLKMKSKLEGVVTWTEEKYGDQGSHYMQLDYTGSSIYDRGGEWFEDTLFTADLQKESLEDLGHIEIGSDCNKNVPSRTNTAVNVTSNDELGNTDEESEGRDLQL